jgi:hypothetical protein
VQNYGVDLDLHKGPRPNSHRPGLATTGEARAKRSALLCNFHAPSPKMKKPFCTKQNGHFNPWRFSVGSICAAHI